MTADIVDHEITGTTSASGRSVGMVVAAIRDHIRRLELLPGEQLRQSDWADRVGVSRVPVREALNSLALAGILTHDPNRGFFVTKYTRAELAQLHYLRGVIEVECVRALEWPTAEGIVPLRHLAGRMSAAAAAGDALGWLEAHDVFHSMILSRSPLTVLVHEAERLYARTEGFRSMRAHNTLEHSNSEQLAHNRILEALEERDRDCLIALFSEGLQVKDSDWLQWIANAS